MRFIFMLRGWYVTILRFNRKFDLLGDRYSEQPRQWSSSSSGSSSHKKNQYKYDEDQRFGSQGKAFKDDEPDETTTTTYVNINAALYAIW